MSTVVAPLLDAPPLRRHGLPVYERPESPAGGAHFVFPVPGQHLIRLVSVFCRLVTSAVAGNRTLRVEYRDDADNVYDVMGNAVTYPASSTEDFSFCVFQPRGEWEVAATNLVPLHPLLLLPTHDFRIFVSGIDATDQLSRIALVYEQFLTGDRPPPGDL